MQTVKDVMSSDVQVISPDAPITEAARRMRDGDFGMMPVGENNRMVGTISDRDIVVRAVAEGRDNNNVKVRDVMSDGVRWAYEDESVERAAAIMGEYQIRRLPIVNRDKRLVGIVALGDIAVKKPEPARAGETLAEISEQARSSG
jgi:CBS domain-containing protein